MCGSLRRVEPMLTKKQLQLIHVAKRQLRLDDDDYRAILRAKGGVDSSKDLSAQGFEDVMAQFEHMGFRNSSTHGDVGDYWRKRQFHRGIFANARQVRLIRQLAARQRYALDAVCLRMSKDRTDVPEKLS